MEFRNQYPAYANDIAGEARKAIDALGYDTTRRLYDRFLSATVYGERPEFYAVLATGVDLAEKVTKPLARDLRSTINGTIVGLCGLEKQKSGVRPSKSSMGK